jgi:uncharacterized protein YxjI
LRLSQLRTLALEGSTMARYRMRQRLLSLGRDFDIEDERGKSPIATVRKALFSPIRSRFAVEVTGGEDLVIEGDILDHEYEIRRGR